MNVKKLPFLLAALLAGYQGLACAEAAFSSKIVLFKKGTRDAGRVEALRQLGCTVKREIPLINAVVVTIPQEQSEQFQALLADKASPIKNVRLVEDDFYTNWLKASAPASLENIGERLIDPVEDPVTPELAAPVYSFEGDPEIPWGIAKVGAPQAWERFTGKGVKVGVVDTGVDLSHPDLAPNIAASSNLTPTGGPGQDDNGHGTHVAGTIAAVRDGKGVVGVAPEASIYAAKVLSASGSGSLSDVVAGIDWAVAQGVKVINMSLGSPYPNVSLGEAVKNATEAGVTVVCAAGNDSGAVNYPAAYPQVVAVSAADESGAMASFSSHGPEIAFIAPGVNVYSTFLNGGYKALRGTSMASPHVAGLAVLAVQAGNKTPAAVRKSLTAAAAPMPGLGQEQAGAGMINAGGIKLRPKH